MLATELFSEDVLKNNTVTEAEVQQVEAVSQGGWGRIREDCGLQWITMGGKKNLEKVCSEGGDVLEVLGKLHAVVGRYEENFGVRAGAALRGLAPVVLTGSMTDFHDKMYQAITDQDHDPQQLGVLLQGIGLRDHPTIKRICDDCYKTFFQGKIQQAEGQVTESHLQEILDTAEGCYTTIVSPLLATDKAKWLTSSTSYIHEAFGRMRCDELFDILVEYPDSIPALQDLRSCFVFAPELYAYLVTSAKETVKKRLLHAGAKTDDIVQLYIDAMKAVDMLFPGQYKAIDAVTGPIQSYLRNRREAATLFVFGLIDDQSSQLAEILQPELQAKRSELCDVEEEEVVEDGKGQQKHVRRLDVLKRLVNTFGGRDYVVSLYRSVLADKLVAREDFDADSEITALELLKVRFGDTPLQNCEVMVRDVAESKRFCQTVNRKGNFAHPGDYSNIACEAKMSTALIQSKLYWPKLPTVQDFTPHPLIAKLQDSLADEYGKAKEPRKIRFQPGVGSVHLTLSLYADSTMTEKMDVDVHAPIPQVSMLLYLAEAQPKGVGVEELAELCTVPAAVVTAKMGYWMNQSLVVLEDGVYTCAAHKMKSQGMVEGDDLNAGADEIMAAEDEEANETIMEFVDGILQTFGPQEVAVIENKLQQFMDDYSRTREGLIALLSMMVTADQLRLSGSKYSVKE